MVVLQLFVDIIQKRNVLVRNADRRFLILYVEIHRDRQNTFRTKRKNFVTFVDHEACVHKQFKKWSKYNVFLAVYKTCAFDYFNASKSCVISVYHWFPGEVGLSGNLYLLGADDQAHS